MIEDFLPDLDDAMQSYLTSAEYLQKRSAINAMVARFRDALPKDQHPAFNQLMDTIYQADCNFSEEAYRAGFDQGRESSADRAS